MPNGLLMKCDKFIPTENSYLCGDYSLFQLIISLTTQLNLKITLCHLLLNYLTEHRKIVKTRKPPVKRKFVKIKGALRSALIQENTYVSNSRHLPSTPTPTPPLPPPPPPPYTAIYFSNAWTSQPP